jgi:hypothetical protein
VSSLTLEDDYLSSPKIKNAWSFTSSLPYIFMTWSVNPRAAIDFISQMYIWGHWSVQNRKGSIRKPCWLYVIHCSSYCRLAVGVMLHTVFVLDLWGLGYYLVYCEVVEFRYMMQPLSEFFANRLTIYWILLLQNFNSYKIWNYCKRDFVPILVFM